MEKNYARRQSNTILFRVRSFYQSQEWQRLRASALWRAGNMCETHGCRSRTGLHVHHVVSISRDPSKRADLSNLEVRCPRCHSRAHAWRHFPGHWLAYEPANDLQYELAL